MCHGMGQCPLYRRVVYPSNEHDSTGTSEATFLSQPSFGSDSAPFFNFGVDGHADMEGQEQASDEATGGSSSEND